MRLTERASLPAARRTTISFATVTPTVWVSDPANGAVFGYAPTGGSPISELSGFAYPQGVATDRLGNLYVADSQAENVYEFAPGTTSPKLTISEAYEHSAPRDVAVDKQRNIYVTNYSDYQAGLNLQEYNSQGTLLKTVSYFQCNPVYWYYFVTVDAYGNIFTDGFPINKYNPADVVEVPAGSTSCQDLHISPKFPGGLAIDINGDLAVTDQDNKVVTVYEHPTFSKIKNTISLQSLVDPVKIAFTHKSKRFWVANADLDAIEFSYPLGVQRVVLKTDLVTPVGVAIVPTAIVGP